MTKSKLDLFIEISETDINGFGKYISIEIINKKYPSLSLGNGGSWCRRSSVEKKIKLATLKANNDINYLWNVTNDEKHHVENTFSSIIDPQGKGNAIIGLQIFGWNNVNTNRPIRKDIRYYYTKKDMKCVNCGNGNKAKLVCDHKNDLYNNQRVLNTKTQTLDDFQTLCNACNLLKRQISIKTIKNGKRYGATNDIRFKIFGIDFTEGNETLDINNPDTLNGTYWYDCIAFRKKILEILKS